MSRRRKPYWDEALGLWVAEIHLGVDGRGKRLRKRVSSKSEALCMKKLLKLERELETGAALRHAPEKVTVEAWLTRWLQDKTPHLEPNTEALYRSLVHRHLVARIGKQQLQKLSSLSLKAFFSSLEADGVGRRTQQNVHGLLKQALAVAVDDELLARNPMVKLKRPPLDEALRKPRETWTVEHARRFIEASSEHRWAALFVLAVATAMRQSEIFGLLRSNVDVKRGFLRVEWALHEVRKGTQKRIDPRLGETLALRPPKTAKSRRIIPLPRVALLALQTHLEQPTKSDFVFTAASGDPIRSRHFADEWERFLQTSGLPRLPFGRLRHTCITLLAEEGVSVKAAQELAGHSTPLMTTQVYTSATARLARQAADAIDRALGPSPSSAEGPPEH